MALAAAARDSGAGSLIVATGATGEAAVVAGLSVHGAESLGEAVGHLAEVRILPTAAPTRLPAAQVVPAGPDLGEVEGQAHARRALEISLAGHHNLALVGPPGIGKTLLLRCAPGLLPPLEDDEAIEVSRIYSVAGLLDRRAPLLRARPFRAPHHTISTQALIGGGTRVRPGEASLAHRGALLLDETLQFRSDALDALREPLEGGSVTIARVEGALTLPARFTLLAAFNPCPCGWRGTRTRACTCEDGLARRYAARLSGPLRDRIDLWVTMAQPGPRGATDLDGVEPSAAVATRIANAWRRQQQRQRGANGELAPTSLEGHRGFTPTALGILAARARRFGLSPRRVHRTARVARTVADLAGAETVSAEQIDEALSYRGEAGP
jgi:magnesium chelatase family protein